MLLTGQGVRIERPRRTLGAVVAALPAVVASGLAFALIARATTWPVSLTQFAAISGAIVLIALALTFAFWSYSCYTLHYLLDRNGLTIAWGSLKHFIPMGSIEDISPGRGEDRPDLWGLSWPGLHVGRGRVGKKEALFYSTHRSPEEIVYVRTAAATYAISPQDPPRFIAEVEQFKQAAGWEGGESVQPGVAGGHPIRAEVERIKQAAHREGRESVRRGIVGGHPIWADRTAQWLALAAVLINAALWGYVLAIYPDLSPTINIEFPPLGEITGKGSRDEILIIPAAALAVLAINLIAGLGFQWRERAATYLLLSGSVFLQILFWVSAGIAVSNA